MDPDIRHAEFDITIENQNKVRIETDGCAIVTEFIEDNDAKRETMGPANIFYSAFAL